MRVLLPLLGAAALCAAPAMAQTAAPAPKAVPAATRTVTLKPDALTIPEIVRSIAAQTGQRILVGPGVAGVVGINLNAVPLEAALTAVTQGTGNTWGCIEVPKGKAGSLTAEQAAALSRAADTLAASAVSVRTADGREVTASGNPARARHALDSSSISVHTQDGGTVVVGVAPDKHPETETVYVVRSLKDAADLRAEQEKTDAEARGANMNLAEDAKSDPAVVNAYSSLRSLSPDQMAIVTREFLTHLTPDEQKILGDAFAKQHEKMKEQHPM